MNLKRIVSVLASLALTLALCPAVALADGELRYEDAASKATWLYRVNDDNRTVTICGCDSNEDQVTVPEAVDGKTVAMLSFGSTSQHWNVASCKKLTLPSTLKAPDALGQQEAADFARALNCFYNTTEYAITGGGNDSYSVKNGVLLDGEQAKVINCPDGATKVDLGSERSPEPMDGEAVVGGGEDEDAITEIGTWAFNNCDSLGYVELLVSVAKIEDAAFFGMDKLEILGVSNEDTELEGDAVVGNNARNFVLTCPEGSLAQTWAAGNGVLYRFPGGDPIGFAQFAFSPSAQLEQDYDSHPTYSCKTYGYVDQSGWDPSASYSKLTEGKDYAVIPESESEEGGSGSYKVYIVGIGNWGGTEEMYYDIVSPGDRKGTEFTSGTNLNVANYKATSASACTYLSPVFANCTSFSVPAAVAFGGKVTALNVNAFKGVRAKKISLGANLKTIGKAAFKDAAKLSGLTIPKNVTTIGASAFSGAKKLKTLTVKSTKLTKKGVKGSLKGSSITVVKVPKSKVAAYTKYFKKSNSGKSVKVKAA